MNCKVQSKGAHLHGLRAAALPFTNELLGKGLRSAGCEEFVGQSRSNETGRDEEFPEDLVS